MGKGVRNIRSVWFVMFVAYCFYPPLLQNELVQKENIFLLFILKHCAYIFKIFQFRQLTLSCTLPDVRKYIFIRTRVVVCCVFLSGSPKFLNFKFCGGELFCWWAFPLFVLISFSHFSDLLVERPNYEGRLY